MFIGGVYMQGITTNKKELELKIEGVNEISISHTASSKSFAASVHLAEHQQRLNCSQDYEQAVTTPNVAA